MKRKKFKYFILVLCILPFLFCTVSSCNKTASYDGQLSSFMANSDVGIYSLDRSSFRYDSTDCQTVRNELRKMVRFQKDDQSLIVNAVFSTLAFEFEKEIDIKVSYLSNSYSGDYSLKTYLVQVKDGFYWLWDSDKKTGLIIPAGD